MSATAVVPITRFHCDVQNILRHNFHKQELLKFQDQCDIVKWLAEETKGSWFTKVMITDHDEYIANYQLKGPDGTIISVPSVPKAACEEVHFVFSESSDAVIFKLIWGAG